MNVACLVPYPLDRVPGQRFRLEQWQRPLERRGVKLTFFPLLSPSAMDVLHRPGHWAKKAGGILAGCLGRVHFAIRRAQEYDVVVIHREAILLGVDWIERLLARRVPTVFDFDDAVWLPNVSSANRRFRFLKGFDKVDRILGLVSAVSAGCRFLAEHAQRYNPRVFVVPTSIDLEHYGPPRSHQLSARLTVGWTGSVTSAEYLRLVSTGLQRAARKIPLRLVLLGVTGYELDGLSVECVPWSSEREVEVIRRFDVGLKPAAREEWVRGKCPMKDIQYMALGVPPVATRFGTAVESIEHGRTGFLCDSDDDWVDAFERLQDPALRQRLGEAARRVVEERYSSAVAADAFARTLEAAVEHFRS